MMLITALCQSNAIPAILSISRFSTIPVTIGVSRVNVLFGSFFYWVLFDGGASETDFKIAPCRKTSFITKHKTTHKTDNFDISKCLVVVYCFGDYCCLHNSWRSLNLAINVPKYGFLRVLLIIRERDGFVA